MIVLEKAATGACNTFSQVAAMRFLLGLCEAAAMPTLYLITAILYRRKEQHVLFGYITLSNGVGAASKIIFINFFLQEICLAVAISLVI